MKYTICLFLLSIVIVVSVCVNRPSSSNQLSVEQWHTLSLDFMGPESSESSAANPFFNYRMDVFFTSPSGRTYKVPGFFAADGEAA